MWALVKDIIGVLLMIYIISQIVLPCFVPGLEYFNLHKKSRKKSSTLQDLDDKADEIKEVKEEVKKTELKIKEIKQKINN